MWRPWPLRVVTAQRTSNVGDNVAHLTYQFLNGVPNQLTQRATPLYRAERQRMDLGVFAQDKWTLERLTLSYGVRFDHFSSYFPEQTLAPGLLVPTPAALRRTREVARAAPWYMSRRRAGRQSSEESSQHPPRQTPRLPSVGRGSTAAAAVNGA